MEQNIGPQYPKDDLIDKTGFRRKARLHQSNYRADILKVNFEEYGNRLTKTDGLKGLNFYNGFAIIDDVRHRYPIYNRGLYSDMLRSEHIPFNFFIPFKHHKTFCKEVFNDLLDGYIQSIDEIKIEYAPPPAEKYLNDRTSFDAYIEYTNKSNHQKGIIGIEVKYTEHEYKLRIGSKEELDIKNENSKYYIITDKCGIYKQEAITLLPHDKFRQIWRNQLLGESILITDCNKFKTFTSLIIFPKANSHFVETTKEYMNLLQKGTNKFFAVTYEEFISVCSKYCPNSDFKNWIDYIAMRYIID